MQKFVEVARESLGIHRGFWLGATLVASATLACGQRDRDPLVYADPHHGNGGTAGTARGGTTGLAGEGGEGPGPSSGGSSSTNGGTGGGSGGSAGLTLDPNEVYIIARVGATPHYGIAHWRTAQTYSIEIPDPIFSYPAFLGSALIYQDGFVGQNTRTGIFRFNPDFTGSIDDPFTYEYPDDPGGNDERVPAPPCTEAPQDFLTGPGERFIYDCGDSLYENGEAIPPSGLTIVQLGYDDLVIAFDGFDYYLARIGEAAPIGDFRIRTPRAIRATPTGFHIVDDGGDPVLWDVRANGSATRLGTYPLPPAQIDFSIAAIDADDALYNLDYIHNVVRRTLDGDSRVVFPDVPDPSINAQFFVTGH
jgi:hypothetical protein